MTTITQPSPQAQPHSQFLHYRCPSPLALLDDEADFLDILRLVLPRHWAIRTELNARQMATQLVREQVHMAAQFHSHQQMLNAYQQEGASPIAGWLRYWQDDAMARFQACGALVTDYGMPSMNGVAFLQAIGDWSGSRVLLTGQADERIAVAAFNQGLIHQYVPKQNPDMRKQLIAFMDAHRSPKARRISALWHSALLPAQRHLLDQTELATALTLWLEALHWTEYVVLGNPFGVLGMRDDGQVGWLQLELAEPDLMAQDLVEMARASGASEQDLAPLTTGGYTADLELRLALQSVLPQGFAWPQTICVQALKALHPEHALRGAVFDVPDQVSKTQGLGWAQFRQAHP